MNVPLNEKNARTATPATPWLLTSTLWAACWCGGCRLHARTYAQTLVVVPPIGDRPRPNLEHVILHALVLAAGICTFIATASL